MSTVTTIRFEHPRGAVLYVCRGHDGGLAFEELEAAIRLHSSRVAYPELGLLVSTLIGMTWEGGSSLPPYECTTGRRGDEDHLIAVGWREGWEWDEVDASDAERWWPSAGAAQAPSLAAAEEIPRPPDPDAPTGARFTLTPSDRAHLSSMLATLVDGWGSAVVRGLLHALDGADIDAVEPECPGPDCRVCAGEFCETHGYDPCECDVIDRHETAPEV